MWENGGDAPEDEFDTFYNDPESHGEVIVDKLWIGSASAARLDSVKGILESKQITCVLSIGESPHCYAHQHYRHISYKRLVAEDDMSELRLAERFHEAADWIHQRILDDKRVLVHCQAGISRSATICIAYLMKHERMDLAQAYACVKVVRPQMDPNEGFMRQLEVFEKRINKKV